MTDALEELGIPYDEERCDIFGLYSSIGTIVEAISNYPADDVYVNVSGGNKVSAIAGMIASVVVDSTPYYVRAEDYSDAPSDITRVTELPTHPIDAPDAEQVIVLKFIDKWSEHEGPPTKGEIIHFSEKGNQLYIRQNGAGRGNTVYWTLILWSR